MKSQHRFILILTIIIGCSKNNSNNDIVGQATDTTKSLTTLGGEEKAMWDYFQSVEKELGKDSQIKKEKIPELIQSLIDNGDLQKPLIFLDGESGTESKVVDYLTYKQFREINPIDLNRNYIIKMQLEDTLASDSTRMNLLKQLSRDSVQK